MEPSLFTYSHQRHPITPDDEVATKRKPDYCLMCELQDGKPVPVPKVHFGYTDGRIAFLRFLLVRLTRLLRATVVSLKGSLILISKISMNLQSNKERIGDSWPG